MVLSPVTGSWTEFSPLRRSSFCWTRIGPLRKDFFVCCWNMDELSEWTFFRKKFWVSWLHDFWADSITCFGSNRVWGRLSDSAERSKSAESKKSMLRTSLESKSIWCGLSFWNLVDLSSVLARTLLYPIRLEFIWFKGAGGQHMADHRNWFYSVFRERRVRSISCYSPHQKILILPEINFGLKT